MGRKSRAKGTHKSGPEQPTKAGTARLVALGVVVVAALGFGVATWKSEPPAPPARPAPPPAPAQEAPPPRPAPRPAEAETAVDAPATPEEYRRLVGQWLRPDGGYVLAVRSVNEEGIADAGYFNPQPINVGEAEVRRKGDALELFVKLQDRNYPGSTYTLTYDEEGDQLVGIYYQALQRASYDVVFVRR